MSPETTSYFLFAYFFATAVVVGPGVFFAYGRMYFVWLAAISLTGVAATTVVASLSIDDSNFIVRMFQHALELDRDGLVAIALGVTVAAPSIFVWGQLIDQKSARLLFAFPVLGLIGATVLGSLIVGKELISPYLPHPGTKLKTGMIGRLAPPEFLIEDYIDTKIIPIRLAVSPAGRVFVSGHLGIAAQEGAVVELIESEDTGAVQEKLVARMLNRPYGLIATGEHLYVSRSGQYTRWTDGSAEQISTGAVTQLSDLDNDGVMDHYHDVVSNLPGAKGPDYLHQNNGIALGPDGALYITTANESDGHPSTSDMAGVILRASGEDFSQLEIYATGLRNPFGLAFDRKGNLYGTDNDSQTGLLGGNLGDKLLQVNEGSFYGHPYATDDAPGVTPPLLRSSFALGGLALSPSVNLPIRYRDSLFVVVYGEGRIMQILFNDQGAVELVPFATIPGAVDLAISPSGEFYVGVYPDKIVRVRLIGETK